MADLASIVARITLDTSGLDAGLARAQGSLSSASSKIGAVGSKMSSVGSTMTRSMTVPLLGVAAGAVKVAMDYEQSMNVLQTASGASGKAMKQLDTLAKEMGAATVFSAGESAAAMVELSKAGMTPAEIQAGALEGAMALAATEGMELADAAGVMTNTLAQFSLEAEDSAMVADVLAAGASASTASVDSLAQSMRQVGPGAKAAGLSINETVGALALFDQMGLKGSDAGTSLKTMLTRLAPATDKAAAAMDEYNLKFTDQEGNFRSLENIAQQLQDQLGELSQAEKTRAINTIFGSDAQRAANILIDEGAKGLGKYIDATHEQGKAQEMADARMKGMTGELEKMKGNIENAALALGEQLIPYVTAIAKKVAEWADAFANLSPETQDLIIKIGAFVAVIGPAILILGKLATAISAIGKAAALMRLAPATAGISALRTTALRGAAGIAGVGLAMVDMGEQTSGAGQALSAAKDIASGAAIGFSVGGPLGAAVGGIGGAFKALHGFINTTTHEFGAATPVISDYASTLDQATGAITRSTRELVTNRQETQGVIMAGEALGLTARDVVSATLGQEGAQKRVVTALEAAHAEYEAGNMSYAKYTDLTEILTQGIELQGSQLRKQQAELRASNQAIETWGKALKGVPKEAHTDIKALGAKPAMSEVKSLAKQYELTPKEVKTVIKALGGTTAKKDIKGVLDKGEELSKNKWVAEIQTSGTDASKAQLQAVRSMGDKAAKKYEADMLLYGHEVALRQLMNVGKGGKKAEGPYTAKMSESGASGTQGKLDDVGSAGKKAEGPYKARVDADTGPAQSALSGFYSSAQGQASSGGSSVGSSFGSGVASGIGSMIGTVAAGAVSLVQSAINAAKSAADIGSPSKVFAQLGKWMGEGLFKGLMGTRADVAAAGRELAQRVHDAFAKQAAAQSKQRMKALNQRIKQQKIGDKKAAELRKDAERDAKDLAKRLDKRADAIAKASKDELKQLGRLAKQREESARELQRANDKLKQQIATSEAYSRDVASDVTSFGGVGAYDNGEGPVEAGNVLDSLKLKAKAAREYIADLASLRKKGLSKATYKDLLEMGVEGGGAMVAALDDASPKMLAAIEAQQELLRKQAAKLGDNSADYLYQAGIRAQQGLIRGLERDDKALERAARKLAHKLARAVRKALKIKSPSELMAELVGKPIVDGIMAGMDARGGVAELHARKLAARLTASSQPKAGGQYGARVSDRSDDRSAAAGRDVRVTVNAPQTMSPRQVGEAVGARVAVALGGHGPVRLMAPSIHPGRQ